MHASRSARIGAAKLGRGEGMDESVSGGARALILDRRFLGLAVLEFWERFAMVGVKSLLVMILADHVLAGDVSQVVGALSLRSLLGIGFGPLSPAGMASQIYGYACALLYAAILLGGLAGDLLLGRRGAVYLGGGVMLAGLVMMTGPAGFLPGLALFAVGTGTLKGNLSAQLGQLFASEAERQRGYALYLGFLNAGAICGPLVCGAVAAMLGWSCAIGAAALALAIGLLGYAAMASTVAPGAMARPREPAGRPLPGVLGASALLIAAILSVYCCYAAYDQLSDAFLLWARERIDLRVGGWPVPVSWFVSLDGAFTLALIALWQWLAPRLAARGLPLDPVSQILLGGLFCAAGYALLTIVSAGGPAVGSLLPSIAYLLLVDAAVVLVWPSGLSLIAAVAPPRLAGFWMGLFYLHGFFASLFVGIAGSYFGRIPDARFWMLHMAVAGAGAGLALLACLMRHRGAGLQAITTSA
jgi:proton-dependent oligopeptide transporter, POT family